jgi:hypothetical protein
MTNFLGNLAQRGAGLAASISPRLAPTATPAISRDARPWSPVGSLDRDANGEGRASPAPRNARDRPAPSPSDSAIETEGATIRQEAAPIPPLPQSKSETREADTTASKPPVVVPRLAASVLSPRDDAAELSGRRMPRRFDSPPNQDTVDLPPAARTMPRPAEPASTAADRPPPAPAGRRHDISVTELLSARPDAETHRAREAAPVQLAPPPSTMRSTAREPGPSKTGREQRTAPASAVPPAQSEAPNVQVRIGKIEIRANQTASPPPRPAKPASRGFAELALARAHLNRNYR